MKAKHIYILALLFTTPPFPLLNSQAYAGFFKRGLHEEVLKSGFEHSKVAKYAQEMYDDKKKQLDSLEEKETKLRVKIGDAIFDPEKTSQLYQRQDELREQIASVRKESNHWYQLASNLNEMNEQKITIYNRLRLVTQLPDDLGANFLAFVLDVSRIRLPPVALAVLELEGDKAYDSHHTRKKLQNLSQTQYEAYTKVKLAVKPALPFSDFRAILQEPQLKVIEYHLRKKNFSPDVLKVAEKVTSQASLEAYIFVKENQVNVSDALWGKVTDLCITRPTRDLSFATEALELLHKQQVVLDEKTVLYAFQITNSIALDVLEELLNSKAFSTAYVPDAPNSKEWKVSSTLPLAERFRHELVQVLPQLSYFGSSQAFKYFLGLLPTGVDAAEDAEKADFLAFLGEIKVSPRMIPKLAQTERLRGLKTLLDLNYPSYKQAKAEGRTFDTSDLPTDHLDSLNEWEVQAYKEATINGHLTVSKRVIDAVNDEFLLNVFRLVLKEQPDALNSKLMGYAKEIGHGFEDRTFALLTRIIKLDSLSLETSLDVIAEFTNQWQFDLSNLFLDKDKPKLMSRALGDVKNTTQYKLLRESAQLGDWGVVETLLDNLGAVRGSEQEWVLKGILQHKLPIKESLEKIRDAESNLEISTILNLQDELQQGVVDRVLKYEELAKANPVEFGEVVPDRMDLSPDLATAKATDLRTNEFNSIVRRRGLKRCPTTSCPEYMLPAKRRMTSYRCPTCTSVTCPSCSSHGHGGTCSLYKEKGKRVPALMYPGLANFQDGLSNVCFYNSSMKMLSHLAAEVPAFRDFLNPQKNPLTQAGDEPLSDFKERQKLQKGLHTLVETILGGVDPQQNGLSSITNQIFNAFMSIAKKRGETFRGTLRRDQIDPHEVVGRMLDFLDFASYGGARFAPVLASSISSKGETKSVKIDPPTSFLPVDITKKNSHLQSLIDDVQKPEYLTGENKFRFDGKLIDAEKTLHLANAPEVLFIQLKRFVQRMTMEHGEARVITEKVHSEVDLDETITVTRYHSSQKDKESRPVERLTYKRVAVVTHAGQQKESGHYRAFTWDKSSVPGKGDSVVCHDDRSVSEVSATTSAAYGAITLDAYASVKREAYLMAYKLVNRETL